MKKLLYSIGAFGILMISSLSYQPVYAENVKDLFPEILPKPTYSVDVQGEGQMALRDLIIQYIRIAKDIISVLAVLWIVIAGIRMLAAGAKDETIKTQFRGVLWVVVGLIVMQIAESVVSVFYGEKGVFKTLEQYGSEVSIESRLKVLEPLMQYLMTFLPAIAVLMVILSGFKIITAGGDDIKAKKQQNVLLWSILGLGIILIARPVVDGIFGYAEMKPEPTKVVALITQVANYLLGFTSLIAVTILIYAAIMMIINFGNDQAAQKSRKMITWALVGIALIISAYTIVTTFIVPTLQ